MSGNGDELFFSVYTIKRIYFGEELPDLPSVFMSNPFLKGSVLQEAVSLGPRSPQISLIMKKQLLEPEGFGHWIEAQLSSLHQ